MWVVLFCALWTRAAKGVQLGAEAKLDFWGRNRGAFSGWRRLDRLEKHAHTGSTDKIPGHFRPSRFTVCGLGWVFSAEKSRSTTHQHTDLLTFSCSSFFSIKPALPCPSSPAAYARSCGPSSFDFAVDIPAFEAPVYHFPLGPRSGRVLSRSLFAVQIVQAGLLLSACSPTQATSSGDASHSTLVSLLIPSQCRNRHRQPRA